MWLRLSRVCESRLWTLRTQEEGRDADACFSFCGVQVCMNFECRSADILSYDCDVEKKCHGHGVRTSTCPSTCLPGVSVHHTLTRLSVCQVCNSNRNCHCDDGWAAPFCEVKGYGGSVDSGPTWNGTFTFTPVRQDADVVSVLQFIHWKLIHLPTFSHCFNFK